MNQYDRGTDKYSLFNKFGLSCTVQVQVSRLDSDGKCLND